MTPPQAEQVHCFRSHSRKAAIPASRMNRRFCSGDSRSGYCDPYRVSFSMTSAQGKSGHSSQNVYPFDFLFPHRMIPHLSEQNSGLLSFGPRHPAQRPLSASARFQMLQSSPHGAIISALNIPFRPPHLSRSVDRQYFAAGSSRNVPVVPGDIILYIDDNKGFMVHILFLQGFRCVQKLFDTR